MTGLTRALRRGSGRAAAGLLLLLVGGSACNDNKSPTEPTTPPVSVSETFTGTLAVNGAITYPFNVSAAGIVTGTLSGLTPEIADAPIAISIALGTWDGTQCTLIVANDKAVKNSIVSGNATGARALCLRVADVGNVAGAPEPVVYTVAVVHN